LWPGKKRGGEIKKRKEEKKRNGERVVLKK